MQKPTVGAEVPSRGQEEPRFPPVKTAQPAAGLTEMSGATSQVEDGCTDQARAGQGESDVDSHCQVQ